MKPGKSSNRCPFTLRLVAPCTNENNKAALDGFWDEQLHRIVNQRRILPVDPASDDFGEKGMAASVFTKKIQRSVK